MITIKKNPETVGKLKVGTSAATPADGELLAGNVKIEQGGELVIDKAEASNGTIRFYKAGAASSYIQYDASENLVHYMPSSTGEQQFYTGGSKRLSISSTGLATFSNGIAFSQTNSTVGGSITSTLSHYEQGTFSPTDGSGAGLTFSSVSCNYTRIGRVVILTGSFSFPTTSSSAQARVTPGTLPFPATGNTAGTLTIATVIGGAGIDTAGYIRKEDNGVFTNVNLSGATIYFNTTYIV